MTATRTLRVAAAPILCAGFMAAGAQVPATAAAATGRGAPNSAIALRARIGRGAWQRSLSIRLVKTRLTSFSLCALWQPPPASRFACGPAAATRLPRGTTLRLEQSPVARAVKRADSPGWGMLATSDEPVLEAVLSNTVSGDRIGMVRYRVTLRDASGKILARSDLFTVSWHP